MFRTIVAIGLSVTLLGCGDGGSSVALKLEKRAMDGDADAIQELSSLSQENPYAAIAAGRSFQLGLAGKPDLSEAMYHYALGRSEPGAWHNAGLVYLVYFFDGLLPDGHQAEPENACFSASPKSATRKAIDCLTMAATEGRVTESALALGDIFAKGRQDVRADRVVACGWYRKAADEHDEVARFKYGECLEARVPGSSETRTAYQLYSESAKSGYIPAIMKLTLMATKSSNLERQYFWWSLLAKAAPEFKKKAQSMTAHIPAKVRASAEKDVDAWLMTHNKPFKNERSGNLLPLDLEKALLYKF
jgi:TPR repeat protein